MVLANVRYAFSVNAASLFNIIVLRLHFTKYKNAVFAEEQTSHEYNGYVTTSINGNCLAWTGISFPDSSFPDGSVARAQNYCRDPDNRGYPHCPTTHGVLPCLVPKCNHSVCADDPSTLCEILKSVICGVKDIAQKLCPKTCGMCANHPVCEDNPMARCETLKEFICGTTQGAQLCPKTCNVCSECFFRSVVYQGEVSRTVDNIICDRWDAHLLPTNPLVQMFPDQSLKVAANYCRDPDNKGHPWCYIKGHHSKSWEFCDVPYCQGTCENDPVTRCENLKPIICQSEHLARLLCPKSCNMCGFGLLEPVHRPPPAHQ
ncbi:hypothetical protein ACJMK2_027022, partial [Sinanodonta woodiana]